MCDATLSPMPCLVGVDLTGHVRGMGVHSSSFLLALSKWGGGMGRSLSPSVAPFSQPTGAPAPEKAADEEASRAAADAIDHEEV